MGRISIARLLGFVIAFALGLAALVNASEFWAGATTLLALAALLGSVLGTALRGWRGGGWLGFAVFGWCYFLLLHLPWLGVDLNSLSDPMVGWAFEKANPGPTPPASTIPVPTPSPVPRPPDPPVGAMFPPPPIAPSSSSPTDPSLGVLDAGLVRPSSEPDLETAFRMAVEQSGGSRDPWPSAAGSRPWPSAGSAAILGVILARRRPSGVASPARLSVSLALPFLSVNPPCSKSCN